MATTLSNAASLPSNPTCPFLHCVLNPFTRPVAGGHKGQLAQSSPSLLLLPAAMVQTCSYQSALPLPFHLVAPAYFLRYPNPFAQHVLSVDVLHRTVVDRPTSGQSQQHGGVTLSSVGSSSSRSASVSASDSSPDSTKPVLLTARLILKKGTLPSWAPKGLIKNAESWVLEVSEVDLEPVQQPSVGSSTGHARGLDDLKSYSQSPFAGMFSSTWADLTRPKLSFFSSSSESEKKNDDDAVPADLRGAPQGRQMRTWTRNLDHTTVLAVAEGLTFTELLDSLADPSAAAPNPAPKATSSDLPSLNTHLLTTSHITSSVSVIWSRIEKFGLKRFQAHMDTSRHGLLHTASILNRISPVSSSATTPLVGISDVEGVRQPLSAASTKWNRLRESLRPPWLDGLPPAWRPIQSMRLKWNMFFAERRARREDKRREKQHDRRREQEAVEEAKAVALASRSNDAASASTTQSSSSSSSSSGLTANSPNTLNTPLSSSLPSNTNKPWSSSSSSSIFITAAERHQREETMRIWREAFRLRVGRVRRGLDSGGGGDGDDGGSSSSSSSSISSLSAVYEGFVGDEEEEMNARALRNRVAARRT